MKKFFIYYEKAKNKLWPLVTSVYDFILFKLGVNSAKSLKKFNVPVLYVGDEMAARITRVVSWLKVKTDYEFVLLCNSSKSAHAFHVDQFDKVVYFRNEWHLRRLFLNISSPQVVHTFGPRCKYPSVAIDYYNRKNIKTLYDLQDVQASNFGLNPPFSYMKQDLPNEKFCFEKATCVVSYSLEPLNVRKIYNTRYQDVLFFPNYLDKIPEVKVDKLEGIHLVYLGGIAGSDKPKAMLGCIQFFWLIEVLTKQKIHFHVYPTPNRNVYLGEYEKISSENPYFHLHKPVPQKQVPTEIAKYHFGILPFFDEDDDRHPTKRMRSTSQKFYNYIEAGLPVLVSQDLKFQSWMAKRVGFARVMTREDFSNIESIVEGIGYENMIDQLKTNRVKYFLEDHIEKLMNLYSSKNVE